MNTGDRKTFAMDLPDIGVKRDVDFIFIKGVGWVADRNVRTGISYNEIERRGYVTGKEVTFDFGDHIEAYNCRILTSTEWDDCMDYDDSDNTWHWKGEFSWVRSIELERAKSSNRAYRGYYSARSWYHGTASYVNAGVGWRPCLEALESDTPAPDVESGS